MKKLMLSVSFALALGIVPSTPANAWWDTAGGFTCGYMDPLTSFLDNIFGPPCPPVAPVQVGYAQPVPQPMPQPMPEAVPVPQQGVRVPVGPYTRLPPEGGCGYLPCGLGGFGGGAPVGYGSGNGYGPYGVPYL